MTSGPTMHRVGSKSGRRKSRRLGMTDKGTSRDSSMGKSFRRVGRTKGVR